LIELSIVQVLLALLPILVAAILYGRSVDDWSSIAWATGRMFVQLILIGFALTAIFNFNNPFWVIGVVSFMSLGAGWIALRPIKKYKKSVLPVFVSVIVSGGLNLVWILAVVIQPKPWFEPAVVIPIAGMVMANAMNSVSLCAERYWADIAQNNTPQDAARTAMTASMIPQINALIAVGLVSLPGMMTGQILSGVSPLIAVRYQIVIMAMVLSTAAFGSFIYLQWHKKN
jgi:putative ABC transport system permease protein